MRIYANKNHVPYEVYSRNKEIPLTEQHKGIYAMGVILGQARKSPIKKNSYCVVYAVDDQGNFANFV